MERSPLRQALDNMRVSPTEAGTMAGGFLVMIAAVLTAFVHEDATGTARVLGTFGLAAVVIGAALRSARLYRAGVRASLPASVARVSVRIRPARGFNTTAATLALGVPAAVASALLILTPWGWLPLVGVMLLGCAAVIATFEPHDRHLQYAWHSGLHEDILERLCMRADIPTPELVVEHGPLASAWTVRGEIHVTKKLLKLLDDAEVEAVLAHELAHLARRDAAVMEICSAPSRVLLAFTGRLIPWVRALANEGFLRMTMTMVVIGALCGPPAFVVGWVSRLSVLGMSRAREFSADAGAVALTGNPSALASALMKLENQRDWTPSADLRQVQAFAMLCIVGTARSRLGRLFSTHPPTAARVRRLEETEARIQAGPYRTRP